MKRRHLAVIAIIVLLVITIVGFRLSQSIESQTPPNSHAGHYTWGEEVNTFKPCGSEKVYWVDAEAVIQQDLINRYTTLALKPYDKVFAVVTGNLVDGKPETDGFESNYDGIIEVQSVISITGSTEADCGGLSPSQ